MPRRNAGTMFGSAQETATEKGPNAAKEDTRRPDNSAPAAESTAVGRPKTVGLDGGELWWTKLEEFKGAGGSYGLLPQRLDEWEDEQRHRSLGHVQVQALIGAKFEFDKRKETWDWIRSFRHCFRLQNSHDVETADAWADDQRALYAEGKLQRKRVQSLNSIGFDWSLKTKIVKTPNKDTMTCLKPAGRKAPRAGSKSKILTKKLLPESESESEPEAKFVTPGPRSTTKPRRSSASRSSERRSPRTQPFKLGDTIFYKGTGNHTGTVSNRDLSGKDYTYQIAWHADGYSSEKWWRHSRLGLVQEKRRKMLKNPYTGPSPNRPSGDQGSKEEPSVRARGEARRISFLADNKQTRTRKPKHARRNSQKRTPSREVKYLIKWNAGGKVRNQRKRRSEINVSSSPKPPKRACRQTAITAEKRPLRSEPEDSDSDSWYNDVCQVCDKASSCLSFLNADGLLCPFLHCSCDVWHIQSDASVSSSNNVGFCLFLVSKGGDLLCCDNRELGCNLVFHLGCHVPALKEVPPTNWYCSYCYSTPGRTNCGAVKRKRAEKFVERMLRRKEQDQSPTASDRKKTTKRKGAVSVSPRKRSKKSDSKSQNESDESSVESHEHEELCEICEKDGLLVKCSTCTAVYHEQCHRPTLDAEKEDDNWSCSYCLADPRVVRRMSSGDRAQAARNRLEMDRMKPDVESVDGFVVEQRPASRQIAQIETPDHRTTIWGEPEYIYAEGQQFAIRSAVDTQESNTRSHTSIENLPEDSDVAVANGVESDTNPEQGPEELSNSLMTTNVNDGAGSSNRNVWQGVRSTLPARNVLSTRTHVFSAIIMCLTSSLCDLLDQVFLGEKQFDFIRWITVSLFGFVFGGSGAFCLYVGLKRNMSWLAWPLVYALQYVYIPGQLPLVLLGCIQVMLLALLMLLLLDDRTSVMS